jgi:hypothetical protein
MIRNYLRYIHRIIINGYDQSSKEHPWRFISHHLWYFAGTSLYRVTSVSGLEPTTAGPYAGISNRMEASRYVDRVSRRVARGLTADHYASPHVNFGDPDPGPPVLGLPQLANHDHFGDRDRRASR